MATALDPLAAVLRQHVQTLAATPREPGTPAHKAAAHYIREHLQQAGFVVAETPFSEGGMSGCNLLTQPSPAQPDLPLLVVGAHYDTIPGSPGADDNASAVAALLELARWLGPRLTRAEDRNVRLQLVAYDLEEYGLLGSYCHCRDILMQREILCGMISLEMLGYADSRPGSQNLPPTVAHLYPQVGNFIGVVGNDRSPQLLQTVVQGMKQVPDLPVEFLQVFGDGRMLAETRRSDHASFWDHDLPALMITDTSFYRNPHYHQASDTPETLDYTFLARVTQGVCAAVALLLRS